MTRAPFWARLGPLVAAALCLAACNVVVTKTPLFARADEAGGPPLRPGLWRFSTDPDCRFDDTTPYADWPQCSAGAVLTTGQAAFYDRKGATKSLQHQEFVLAAGEPRIFQARVSLSGDVTSASPPFIYAGARATKVDDAGRILAIAYWPVQCGPPPPDSKESGKLNDGGTLHPLPGLTMKPGEPVCTTQSQTSLRAAARASEVWTPKALVARWLRDGDAP